jgi:hypothetical protein
VDWVYRRNIVIVNGLRTARVKSYCVYVSVISVGKSCDGGTPDRAVVVTNTIGVATA